MEENTIKYNNYNIVIKPCEYSDNPCQEWDIPTTFLILHKKYSFGNEHDFKYPDDLNNHVKEGLKNGTILYSKELFLYDHSGITISTSEFNDTWDSGQIGYVVIYKDQANLIGLPNDADYNEIIESDVELVDNYIRGEVYCFLIKNSNNDIIDTCSGFYGCDHDKSGLLDEAKSIINAIIESNVKKHFKRIKSYIFHKVPLIYRMPCQL